MKRFLPTLGIAALVLGFTLLFQVFHSVSPAVPKWQALPGGGEIAFHEVTFATHHEVDHPKATLSERFADAVRFRALTPLFQKPGRSGFGGSPEPSLGVWFAFRQTSHAPQLKDCELILPDGQIYFSKSSGSSGSEKGLCRIAFQVAPYTVEKLVVAATINGKRFRWETPNPTYVQTSPTVSVEPLPQTRKAGDYEVTLRELKLVSNASRRTNWTAEPVFTVSLKGEDVTNQFFVSSSMSDRGLLSAPVWRINVGISRTERYPFAGDEIEWLGTVRKAEAETLRPEEYVLVPITEVAGSWGIRWAGVFGPGQYEMSEQAVLKAAPLPDVQTTRTRPIVFDGKTNHLHVALKKPSVVVLSGLSSDAILVFRTLADKPVYPYTSGGTSWGPSLDIYDAPEEPLRYGVADRRQSFTDGKPIRFLVRPPAIPKE